MNNDVIVTGSGITLADFKALIATLDRQHGDTRYVLHPWDYEPMRSLMDQYLTKEYRHLIVTPVIRRPVLPPEPLQYASKHYTEAFIRKTIVKYARTNLSGMA
jgi:hypothetical protein